MKSRKKRRREEVSDLNITNLVDVIFALLIIFMITAPMMTQGVQVDLPKAESEAVESDEKLIQISITKESEFFINDTQVQLRDFAKTFRVIFNNDPEIPVFINADKTVPYGIVIGIIGSVQKAGAVKLGFLTEPIELEK